MYAEVRFSARPMPRQCKICPENGGTPNCLLEFGIAIATASDLVYDLVFTFNDVQHNIDAPCPDKNPCNYSR